MALEFLKDYASKMEAILNQNKFFSAMLVKAIKI
jgi:hypothetical protein